MKSALATFGFIVAAAATACSEGSGTLALTVDSLPKFVRDSSVLVIGTVMRTPAKATDIIVSVAGGVAAAADTFRGSSYTVRVRLNINAANALTVSATDATGSTATSVNVSVRQDGAVPTIALVTPADTSDNVAIATPITVKFSEPVVLAAGGGLRLTRQGAQVTGTTTRSADSFTLTFVPAAALSPNAIYQLALSGITDVAANAAPAGYSACFVTTPTGSTASMSFNDSPGDTIYQGGSASTPLLAPDLVSARFAREGTLFSGVVRFSGPRIFSGTASNQGLLILEVDTDQDSTTGFWTLKDTLFFNSPTLGPTYSSGTKAEYIIDLEPTPEVGDSAFVGRKESAFNARILGAFLPGTCGPFTSFVLPFSVIGNDDGKMNAVLLGIAGSATQILVDPMPTRGHLALDVKAPPGLAPAYGAEALFTLSRTARVHRFPPRRVPLR